MSLVASETSGGLVSRDTVPPSRQRGAVGTSNRSMLALVSSPAYRRQEAGSKLFVAPGGAVLRDAVQLSAAKSINQTETVGL